MGKMGPPEVARMNSFAVLLLAMLPQQASRSPVRVIQGPEAGLKVGTFVPSGSMILADAKDPPAGYASTGLTVLASTGATPAWRTRAPMPTARYGLAAATVDGLIYAIGGTASTITFFGTVEVYNPSTDTWSTKTPMTTPRYGLVSAVVEGKIYAIGGSDALGATATVEAYDAQTDTWQAKAPLLGPRAHHAAAAVNGRIYVVGGEGTSGLLASVEEYDPQTDTWTSRASMPTARNHLAAASVGGLVYALGGGSSPTAKVEAYVPVSDSWSGMVPMPSARMGLAACTAHGKVYAVGDSSLTTAFEEFEPWVSRSPMRTARYFLAATAVEGPSGRIYAVGGHNGGSAVSTNEEFETGVRVLYVHRRE